MATNSNLDTLLDKLSTDNDFREQFLGDPAGALGSLGITVDASQIPAVRSLPSKESLANDLTAIRGKLDSNMGQVIFLLTGNV